MKCAPNDGSTLRNIKAIVDTARVTVFEDGLTRTGARVVTAGVPTVMVAPLFLSCSAVFIVVITGNAAALASFSGTSALTLTPVFFSL